MAKKKIFVTHAAADEPLAKALVDLLKLATNVTNAQVFCSSVEGAGVPTGARLLRYVRKRLRNTVLAIPLVTANYLVSPFCQWELGAIWVRGTDTFPLVVRPVSYADLSGPLSDRKIDYIDEPAALGRLHDRVKKRLSVPAPRTDAWRAECDQFLRALPENISKCELSERMRHYQARERLARFGEAAEDMHAAFHSLRDAAFIRILHGPVASHKREFYDLLRASVDAMSRAFSTITGVPCRICVKQTMPATTSTGGSTARVVEDERAMLVFDLVRSGGARPSYTITNPDWVHENTDFANILEGKGNFFFSNDLVELARTSEYKNSHPNPAYVSTIVWPIRKWTPDLEDTMHPFLGFLCVDSEVTEAFDEHYDFSVGAGFADTLYHVLHPWLGDNDVLRNALTR